MATSYTSLVQSLTPQYCPSCPLSLPIAVMNAESSGNPNAVSPAGAIGLFQLMPGTAAQLGVTNIYDPTQNATAGLSYLQQMFNQFGSWDAALEAYNEGPGALQSQIAAGTTPVSAGYASSILSAAGVSPDDTGDSNSDPVSSLFDLSALVDLSNVSAISWPLLGGIAASLLGLVYLTGSRQ